MRAVPLLSLAQAGCMCVCRSAAWDAKTVTSAWWVHADQASPVAEAKMLGPRRLIASNTAGPVLSCVI